MQNHYKQKATSQFAEANFKPDTQKFEAKG